MNENLETRLRALESAGLIRQTTRDLRTEYAFRHVLSLEASYESMLKADRRRLHQDVGSCLERLGAGNLDEIAPILARHFDEAGDDARALAYLSRAAATASHRYATREAIMLLDRALEVALRSATPGAVIGDLCVRAGRLREMSGDYAGALRSYDRLEDLANARSDAGMTVQAYLARAAVFCAPTTQFDATQGLAIAERAHALARAAGDRASECKANWLMLLAYRWIGKPDLAEQAGLASIAIARELGLGEQLAYALNDLGLIFIMTGRAEFAIDTYREAEKLWRELDNLPLLADTLTNLGYLGLNLRGPNAVMAALTEAEGIGDAIGNVWGQSYSRTIHSQALLMAARYDEAVSLAYTALVLARQAGFAIAQIMMPVTIAWADMDLGQPARAAGICRDALATATNSIQAWRGNPAVMVAMCEIRAGDRAAADAAMAVARQLASPYDGSIVVLGMAEVEYARLSGTPEAVLGAISAAETLVNASMGQIYLPWLWGQRGDALLTLGRIEEAEASTADAVALMETQGSRAWAWRLRALQAQIATARGDSEEARTRREQARAEIAYVAGHATSDETRAAFLKIPEVNHIRGQS